MAQINSTSMKNSNLQKSVYRTPEWAKLRLAALRRDQWVCATCNASLRGKGAARVDHIQPVRTHPQLALRLDNLRCLCPSCDNKRHAEKGHGGVERIPVAVNGFPEGW